MTSHVRQIKRWFEAAVPAPTDKNRAVQLGCHYEEVAEMCEATGNLRTAATIWEISVDYKRNGSPFLSTVDRKELLDSLCDQIVTAIGVAHMFGLDVERALTEVDRSNWSKFVEGKPVFDANGKIAKPPTYSPPDLTGMY